MSDVVVIGAGIVGVSCAYYASQAGLSVTVLERGTVSSGTTSRGEGNLLVSDKAPGPELDLALRSRTLWLQISASLGADRVELEQKGGLVVATDDETLTTLHEFGRAQQAAGVDAIRVTGVELPVHEPHIARDLAGGMLYAEDMQVQPVLATAALLAAAKSQGARLEQHVSVTGVDRDSTGRITAVLAGHRRFPADAVVNATGTWGSEVSALLGAPIPVLPRRGFVLVTEPLPSVVRHKVYSADYVSNVASNEVGIETSAVIEGTSGGTVLIGASRERVGFDETLSVDVVRRLATQAVLLFPFLADISLMHVYRGFRPYCPDHLPVIGPDLRVEGLFHACGHEGAGIGLAPATGEMISQLLIGQTPLLDPTPFDPLRFEQVLQ
jgi:glycine/D-amino acid oxidase-like deaminating enzyme